MSEETLTILKMLQEGKVTPEQAEALLKAIPVAEKKADAAGTPQTEVPENGMDEVQRKLSELQARLAALQHNLGATHMGVIDRFVNQLGDWNVKPVLDDATAALKSAKHEFVRSAKLAARIAERQTRKLRAEAKHAGRKLVDEYRLEFSQKSRPANIHGVPESVDIVTSSAPASIGAHVNIVNPLGNIRVVKSAKAAVTVKATKTAWSSSSEIRANRLKSVRIAGPEHESGLTGLSVYVVPESTELRDMTVDLEVAVPAGVRLGAESGFGDIFVEDINVSLDRIESFWGSVSIKNVKQPKGLDCAKVLTRSGAASIVDFDGGALDVSSASGPISLSGIASSTLVARTASSDVEIKDLKSEDHITINSASGTIKLDGVETPGAVHVSVGSGDIVASNIDTGALELRTISGDIEINRVDTTSDKLSLSTVSGDIDARELLSDAVTVGTTSGDARLHFSEPVIRSLGASTTSGDITVSLTGETGARVELKTLSGKLLCEVPIIEDAGTYGRGILKGTIGDGNGSIKMQSVSGDLRIGA